MAEIILPGRDFTRGVHQTSEETKGGIIIPSGANAASVRILRDGWTKRAGDGRAEETGIIDPVTQKEQKVIVNRDEVARLWLWASADNGQSWDCIGMCGTLGGPVPMAFAPGSVIGDGTPLVPGPETTLFTKRLREGMLIRVVMECLVDLRAEIDIDFVATRETVRTARHNSVGFVTANDNHAASASSVSSGNITPSGSNRLAIIKGSAFDTGTISDVTVTWDSGAVDAEIITFNETIYGGSGDAVLTDGYVVAPATSAAQGTSTANTNCIGVVCAAEAYDGVDQTTPTGGEQSNETTGSSVSIDTTSVNSDDMVSDHALGQTSVSVNESNTERFSNTDGAVEVASSTKTGSGTVTTGWSGGNGSGIMMVAFRINAATAATATPKGVFNNPFYGPFGGPI